ncbi:MAG: ABC transporter permease [Saprospiraceae bacterium]|nr:ABC transporter permease [Saprospiraceae bacterium]
MKVYNFIAKRSFSSFKKSFTKSIIRLSVIATSLSLAVMIVAQSIFNGFQTEIAKKVFGFWGHIRISDIKASQSQEPIMLIVNDSIRNSIKTSCVDIDGKPMIQHVQSFLLYPSIMSQSEFNEGLFLKGVGKDFHWEFFNNFLVEGKTLELNSSEPSRDVMISKETAERLETKIGQSIILHFFVDNEVLKRKVRISGIYNTGLGEYDKKFAFVDIQLLQTLLGLEAHQVSGLEVICNDVLEAEIVNKNFLKKFCLTPGIQKQFGSSFHKYLNGYPYKTSLKLLYSY